jgi:hypothetical protein
MVRCVSVVLGDRIGIGISVGRSRLVADAAVLTRTGHQTRLGRTNVVCT